nr:hypothetical protein [Kineosphaera limosa]
MDEAIDLARTGDLWIFRGDSRVDRTIRAVTNAPVNHVAMAVALDDLPPLLWHAELGKGLRDVWTGQHQRGVQLHDLREAVTQWTGRYGQHGWFRQLSPEVTRDMEDAVLRTIARWDGTPFPGTAALAGRWLRGRAGRFAQPRQSVARLRQQWAQSLSRGRATAPPPAVMTPTAAYCAEVVAVTYQAMGLLEDDLPSIAYDPGAFWSGDRLRLTAPFTLGAEIAVRTD